MKRDAYGLGVALALMLAMPAFAQGFAPLRLSDTGDTCYSWQGGNFSAGSFSKCQPVVVIAAAPVVPAPLAAAPTPAPVMMPMQSCPPTAVPRKPIIKPKRKPPVKC